MSLLAVDGRGKPHIFKVEVDAPTAAELRLYALYSNNTTVEKVCQAALKHMVEKFFPTDDKFQQWKQKPENQTPPEPRRRRHSGHHGSTNENQAQPPTTAPTAVTPIPPNLTANAGAKPK